MAEYNCLRYEDSTLRKGMKYESWSLKQNGIRYDNLPEILDEYHGNIVKIMVINETPLLWYAYIIAVPDK